MSLLKKEKPLLPRYLHRALKGGNVNKVQAAINRALKKCWTTIELQAGIESLNAEKLDQGALNPGDQGNTKQEN